eukprot:2306529-Alexandrium_andersonii.AAC.1
MSASLVGSEMCIRDSRNTPPTNPGTPRTARAHTAWGIPPHCARSGNTVSYTHLTLPTICSV